MRSVTLTMLIAVTMGGPIPQQEIGSPTSTGKATIEHCQIFLIQDVEVPAEQPGRLVRVDVREEDIVERGDLLAKIDDRQAQLQKTAAKLERDKSIVAHDTGVSVSCSPQTSKVGDWIVDKTGVRSSLIRLTKVPRSEPAII